MSGPVWTVRLFRRCGVADFDTLEGKSPGPADPRHVVPRLVVGTLVSTRSVALTGGGGRRPAVADNAADVGPVEVGSYRYGRLRVAVAGLDSGSTPLALILPARWAVTVLR